MIALSESIRLRLAAGEKLDDIVAGLRSEGFSILDAIKGVRSGCCVSLGEAKTLVTSNPAWADIVENGQELHDALWDAFVKNTES